MHASLRITITLALGLCASVPAFAADPAGSSQGGAIARFFGFAPRYEAPAPLPVPDYLRREADDEGALDTLDGPLDRNVNRYDRALDVGRIIDERLFGLPQSPENELKDKLRRAREPGALRSRSGILDGLTTVSPGRSLNAAPRIQDVAKLCDDARTLADIAERFNWAQDRTWETDVRMVAVEHPRETSYRTVGDYAYLSKRYCRATAVLNTGHKRAMVYQIVEDTGGAGGFYDRARFCVRGYDRMREYEPLCRVLSAR